MVSHSRISCARDGFPTRQVATIANLLHPNSPTAAADEVAGWRQLDDFWSFAVAADSFQLIKIARYADEEHFKLDDDGRRAAVVVRVREDWKVCDARILHIWASCESRESLDSSLTESVDIVVIATHPELTSHGGKKKQKNPH